MSTAGIPDSIFKAIVQEVGHEDFEAYVMDGQTDALSADPDDGDDWHDVVVIEGFAGESGGDRILKFVYSPEDRVLRTFELGPAPGPSSPSWREPTTARPIDQAFSIAGDGPDQVVVESLGTGAVWRIGRTDPLPDDRLVPHRLAAAWFGDAPAPAEEEA